MHFPPGYGPNNLNARVASQRRHQNSATTRQIPRGFQGLNVAQDNYPQHGTPYLHHSTNMGLQHGQIMELSSDDFIEGGSFDASGSPMPPEPGSVYSNEECDDGISPRMRDETGAAGFSAEEVEREDTDGDHVTAIEGDKLEDEQNDTATQALATTQHASSVHQHDTAHRGADAQPSATEQDNALQQDRHRAHRGPTAESRHNSSDPMDVDRGATQEAPPQGHSGQATESSDSPLIDVSQITDLDAPNQDSEIPGQSRKVKENAIMIDNSMDRGADVTATPEACGGHTDVERRH
jgi:hypothetical protein